MYQYICMCVCMNINVSVRLMCVYINLSGPLHLCVYMNLRVPVHLHVCVHAHKCSQAFTCVCMNISGPLNLCVCVMHAHVFAYKIQRATLDFFLSHSTPYFGKGFSQSPELSDLIKLLTSKPQRSSCLILTGLWLQVHSVIPSFFILLLEIWTQVLMITRHALYQLCISPAVFLFSLYTVLGWLRETSLPSVPASLFQYFCSIPWSFVLYQEFGSISVFYNYSIIDIAKAPSLILWG